MKKLFPYIALALALAQLLLILTSWVWSAAMPLSGVRSMLSSEGIRWYLGHFAELMASPFLVWLLLGAMAYGAVVRCRSLQGNSYRSSRARLISMVFLVIYVGVVLLLTVSPHAVLLSASGLLWPSPFSASLVPITVFGILMAAILYGVVAGTFQTLSEVYDSLVYGLRQCAPLLPIYVLFMQLFESFRFVLP
ncbi:MAG: ABC transporter substrate-binding protein [Prevotella sp.]|nr:ABC transporter substrate-binding protein [Prevotella sp.]